MSESFTGSYLAQLFASLTAEAFKQAAPHVSVPIPRVLDEQYRDHLNKRYQTLYVWGMKKPILLDDFYMDTVLAEGVAARLPYASGTTGGDAFKWVDRQDSISGLDLLKKERRLVVLGGPGMGKSTFLKRALQEAIRGNFSEPSFPIMVELKRVRDQDLRKLMLDELRVCKLPLPRVFLETVLASGRAILFFDGLDEVPPTELLRVTDDLRRLVEQYPDNRYVVACRAGAYEYWLDSFLEAEVAPLRLDQVGQFVRRWFGERNDIAVEFLKDLDRSGHLKDLASTPLFLTLMCMAFEEPRSFPPTKADLYGKALTVLLEKWDPSRNVIRENPYRQLTTERKKLLFATVAIEWFEQNQRVWSRRQLNHRIARFMDKLPGGGTVSDPGTVLDTLHQHHGILTEVAHHTYAFSHQGFQEYFTAYHVVERGNRDTLTRLLNHIADDQWEEVFYLVAAMLPEAEDWLTEMTDRICSTINHADLATLGRRAHATLQRTTPYTPVVSRHLALSVVVQQLLIKAAKLDEVLSLATDDPASYSGRIVRWGSDVGFDQNQAASKVGEQQQETMSPLEQEWYTLIRALAENDRDDFPYSYGTSYGGNNYIEADFLRRFSLGEIGRAYRAQVKTQQWQELVEFGVHLYQGMGLAIKGLQCLRAGSFLASKVRLRLNERLTSTLRWGTPAHLH